MSHYSNLSWSKDRVFGEKLFNKQSTHHIRYCWGCRAEILQKTGSKRTNKICEDCKINLTTEQIKRLYSEHFRHQREMLAAKRKLKYV